MNQFDPEPNLASPSRLWWCRPRVAVLMALVIWVFYLTCTTRSTLWDRDEPRFATASVEMVNSGNYLYPTFNGQLRPDKPVLIYWLMSTTIKLFGPTELAVRFFAPLGTLLACLFTWIIGRRLFSEEAAWWAMMILATTPQMFISGMGATTDAVLLACIVGAIVPFVLTITTGFRAWHIVIMTIAMGLAQLNKGPVGIAVPLMTIFAAMWLGRRDMTVTRRYWLYVLIAAAVSVGMFLAWAIPANTATGNELAQQGLGHHVVNRILKPQESHGGPIVYYIPVIIAFFAPWTLFLPGALSALLGKRLAGVTGRAILLGWFLPTFILMSLVATKLPHYILPTFPAMALAIGATLSLARQDALDPRDRKWLRRGVWLYAPVGIGQALAAAALGVVLLAFEDQLPPKARPWGELLTPLAWPCVVLGAVLGATAVVAIRDHLAGRWQRAAASLLIGTLASNVAVASFVMPATEEVAKLSPAIAEAIRREAPGTAVFTYEFGEPSLNFYLNGPMITPLFSDEQVVQWVGESLPATLVIPRKYLDRIVEAHGPLPVREIAARKGVNHANGKLIELVAVLRGG